MAAAPKDLGDFFAKKKKKNVKGSNMNNEAADKVEEKTTKSKDKEDKDWVEVTIAAPVMLVPAVGKLTVEEEPKDQEDTAAPAWGAGSKKKGETEKLHYNEKKFPTLKKAVIQNSNINIDDGSKPDINIKTSKNAFSALEDDDGDGHEEKKRPSVIKPATVKKAQGERASVAVQREVDKYVKKGDKKKKKKDDDSDEDDSDEEEEEEEEEEEAPKRRPEKKKPAKAKEPVIQEEEEEEKEIAEDLQIVPDEKASRAKYIGRPKLDTVPLPKSELQEEKVDNSGGLSKKKQKFLQKEQEEEDDAKKLAFADWDE